MKIADFQQVGWWVLRFYIEFGGAFLAFFSAKHLVWKMKSRQNPSALERAWRYTACIAIVAIGVSAFFGERQKTAWMMFGILLPPALFGVSEGLRAEGRPPRESSRDDQW